MFSMDQIAEKMASSRRGQTWGHKEILALIRICLDQAIQDRLDGATWTSDIYKMIVPGTRRSWVWAKLEAVQG